MAVADVMAFRVVKVAPDDPIRPAIARMMEGNVGAVRTRQLVPFSPGDEILDAARLMSDHRVRHLPVLEGENLLGVVGMREVVRVLVERLWQTHDPEARERARELLSRPGSTVS